MGIFSVAPRTQDFGIILNSVDGGVAATVVFGEERSGGNAATVVWAEEYAGGNAATASWIDPWSGGSAYNNH